MKAEGKVRVVVRSRRVPIGIVYHTEPVYTTSGMLVGSRANRLVLYGKTLDGGQRKAIDEGQRLSQNLGLDLEVIDESRKGILGRLLSPFRSADGGSPSVMVAPSSSESGECVSEGLGKAH